MVRMQPNPAYMYPSPACMYPNPACIMTCPATRLYGLHSNSNSRHPARKQEAVAPEPGVLRLPRCTRVRYMFVRRCDPLLPPPACYRPRMTLNPPPLITKLCRSRVISQYGNSTLQIIIIIISPAVANNDPPPICTRAPHTPPFRSLTPQRRINIGTSSISNEIHGATATALNPGLATHQKKCTVQF